MTFFASGLITEPLEAGDAKFNAISQKQGFGIIHAVVHLEKGFEL
jgi:hypothetical protein